MKRNETEGYWKEKIIKKKKKEIIKIYLKLIKWLIINFIFFFLFLYFNFLFLFPDPLIFSFPFGHSSSDEYCLAKSRKEDWIRKWWPFLHGLPGFFFHLVGTFVLSFVFSFKMKRKGQANVPSERKTCQAEAMSRRQERWINRNFYQHLLFYLQIIYY